MINSFFDKNFQSPAWLQRKVNRRNAIKGTLKSAAGATAIAALPIKAANNNQQKLTTLITTEPWLTLNAVLEHLLPVSASGPSAIDIQATQYLLNVVQLQPTEQEEVDFIYKGVGWLNGYTQSQVKKDFFQLKVEDKETMLRAISKSRAGENWLSNLVNYIFEAMLSPPVYGGNPNGIGWQWLDHQPGFPLPKEGDRYYELPGRQSIAINMLPTQAYREKALLAKHGKKS